MESWMNGWAKTSLNYCTFLVVQCVVCRHAALLDVNLGAFGLALEALGSPGTPLGSLWGSLGCTWAPWASLGLISESLGFVLGCPGHLKLTHSCPG